MSIKEIRNSRGDVIGAVYSPDPVQNTVPPEEGLCQLCSKEYQVWYADNELWNPVMRLDDGSDVYPFLCPTCFMNIAEVSGIAPKVWRLSAPDSNSEGAKSSENTASRKLAQEATPDHIEDELDTLLDKFSTEDDGETLLLHWSDQEPLKSALTTLINKKLVEARIDEVAKANHWALQHDLNFASKHKWFAYYSDRIAELKGDSHE